MGIYRLNLKMKFAIVATAAVVVNGKVMGDGGCDPMKFSMRNYKDENCKHPASPWVHAKDMLKPAMAQVFTGDCEDMTPIGNAGKWGKWTCDSKGVVERVFTDDKCHKRLKAVPKKGIHYNWGKCTYLPVAKHWVKLKTTQDF